jgi:hypothetical protein
MMGYTHYYTRTHQVLDPTRFAQFVADCQQVCLKSEIPIAGWNGKGQPAFTKKKVSFNGVERCQHVQRDLGIPWPSHSPRRGGMRQDAPPTGAWFAGAALDTRTCDGDCSHETFLIEQCFTLAPWQHAGDDFFACCKTAYKPYDILVTACLIIFTHYFGAEVQVSSDGESQDWEDARRLCQHVLGYGADFQLRGENEDADAQTHEEA